MKKCLLTIIYILTFGCSTTTNIDDTSTVLEKNNLTPLTSIEETDEFLSPTIPLSLSIPVESTSVDLSVSEQQKTILAQTMKEAFLQLDSHISFGPLTYSVTKQIVLEESSTVDVMRKDIYFSNDENNPTASNNFAITYVYLMGNIIKEVLSYQGRVTTFPAFTTLISIYTSSGRQIHNLRGFSLSVFEIRRLRKRISDTESWGSWQNIIINYPDEYYTEHYLVRELDQGLETIPVIITRYNKIVSPPLLNIEVQILGDHLDSKNPNYIVYNKQI